MKKNRRASAFYWSYCLKYIFTVKKLIVNIKNFNGCTKLIFAFNISIYIFAVYKVFIISIYTILTCIIILLSLFSVLNNWVYPYELRSTLVLSIQKPLLGDTLCLSYIPLYTVLLRRKYEERM